MGIVDHAKNIAELIKKYNDVELYQKIIDLSYEIFELKEDNLKKKINEKMVYESPFYWLKDGENKDGPYCQKCYDDKKKLSRLQDNKNGYWECLVCKSVVAGPSYRSPN